MAEGTTILDYAVLINFLASPTLDRSVYVELIVVSGSSEALHLRLAAYIEQSGYLLGHGPTVLSEGATELIPAQSRHEEVGLN